VTEAVPTETSTEATTTDGVEATALNGGADVSVETGAEEAATTEGKTDAEAKVDEKKPEAEVPEKYEFTPVDGVEIDQAAVELATPVLKDLGLSNDQANKLVPVLQGVIANRDQQMIDSITTERAKWLTSAKADPEIGGKAFGDNLALAATALDRLGFVKDSPFRKLLDESGLGNHPEMIRAWSKVGKAIGEDSDFIRTANPSVKKSDDAILYPDMTKTGE
jgi:hypothetical protein